MDNQMKFVEFDIYCKRCKYSKVNETEEPCNECLNIPQRVNTHVPEYWESENTR